MALIYHLTTGHKLPKKKAFYNCRCKAVDEINSMLNSRAKKLSASDVELSVRLLRVDDEVLPEYRKLFAVCG